MEYINEHTLIGDAGYLLVITAFVTCLSCIFCFVAAGRSDGTLSLAWDNFGKKIFLIHSLAVFAVVGLLFFMIASHYFEYQYVWKYSSLSMEPKYIFSCFWSGQEGSFLLWSLWITVLSWIFIMTGKEWVKYTMPMVLIVQAFIFSMLLGVYLGDFKIGNNPFILIRELPENVNLPWARMEDYLLQITSFQDGVGLNPLLQNYWMTIHPPVLFLGFAATLFPFAFVLGALACGKLNGWAKPAMPWSLFALASLGAGILLGGAWAYESLSFGGFWAWDPVENASLVPWLVLLAGVHCMLVYTKRKRGNFIAILLCASPFLLVLYSTFLTRSGILGESSVHSFTENGLFVHLLIFLFSVTALTVFLTLRSVQLRIIFLVVSAAILLFYLVAGNAAVAIGSCIVLVIVLLLITYERHYTVYDAADIQPSSREFWMFAAALLVLVSAIQISMSTSIPVINRIFDLKLDAFTDLGSRNVFYHNWQIPIAILVTILMGVSQYLNYRNTEIKLFINKMKWSALIAVIAGFLLLIFFRYNFITEWRYALLLLSCIFGIAFNIDFAKRCLQKGNGVNGSSLAHIGFILLLMGALIAGSRRSAISVNQSSINLSELNKDFRNEDNILLKRGDTVFMQKYFVTFEGTDRDGVNLRYGVRYHKPVLDEKTKRLSAGEPLFTLYPKVQLNEKFGNVAEPGTHHSLTHDIFTHIKYADMEGVAETDLNDGFMGETKVTMELHEAVAIENYRFKLESIYLLDNGDEKQGLGYERDDIIVKATVRVNNYDSKDTAGFTVEPLFVVRDSSSIIPSEVFSPELDAKLRIAQLGARPNSIDLGLRQRDFIVMQAYIFPGMNILWTGCIMMILGCVLSLKKYLGGEPSKIPEKIVPATTNALHQMNTSSEPVRE